MPKNKLTFTNYKYSIEEDDHEFVWSVYLVIDEEVKVIEDGFSESYEDAFSDAKDFATQHFKSQSPNPS